MVLLNSILYYSRLLVFHGLSNIMLDQKNPSLVSNLQTFSLTTLPTAEILSGKNAQAWVSMVLYLKNK